MSPRATTKKASAWRIRGAPRRFPRGLLTELGRKNVITVFLTCSPRERVLRCAAREGEKIIPGARAHLEKVLPDLPQAEFADYLAALEKLNDPCRRRPQVLERRVARADRDVNAC